MKAVIFDVGGVLRAETESHQMKYLSDMLGLELSIIKDGFKQPCKLLNKGVISEDEFWHLFERNLNTEIPSNIRKGFEQVHTDLGVIDKDMLAFARSLKKKYIVGILSNTIDRHVAMNKRQGTYKGFKPVILSNVVHAVKPEHTIYKLLLVSLPVKAEEILFIDDRQENIDAARAMGMLAVRCTGKKTLAKLRKII